MRFLRRTLGVVAMLGAGVAPAHAQYELSARNFDQVVRTVRPTPAESQWMQVPWLIDVNEARKQAAAQGKPLFVWSMSAEPLGTC